ncbi:RHS repeat-associated core domain-containing protein [Mucilaginibacter sp.]
MIARNKRSDGTVDVLTYSDYYPFGSIARNGGNGYRYEYQGAYAEKDPVTGYSNFDLRMYDGRIGRWLSVDPMGQYASLYEGTGNNPVNGSDPIGGEGGPGPGFWNKFWNSVNNLIGREAPAQHIMLKEVIVRPSTCLGELRAYRQ